MVGVRGRLLFDVLAVTLGGMTSAEAVAVAASYGVAITDLGEFMALVLDVMESTGDDAESAARSVIEGVMDGEIDAQHLLV